MKHELIDYHRPTISEIPVYSKGTEVCAMGNQYTVPDLIDLSVPIYHDAFQAGVWKEDLTEAEIRDRLSYCFNKQFAGYWLLHPQNPDLVLGASWYEFTDLATLSDERKSQNGVSLTRFLSEEINRTPNLILLWHRETLVHPLTQGRGLAKRLKNMIFEHLQELSDSYHKPILVATRMRDDNRAIIHVNDQLGMLRTGVRHPASQNELNLLNHTEPINHEYWIKYIQPEN